MSEFDILVLGDANPDLVLRGGDVAPAFGQAERLVEEARLVVGGSGAIFACGAARLGLRVAFAGVVGDDLFGAFIRGELEARGVDTSAMSTDLGRPTGITVVLARRDDRAMLTSMGTIGDLRRSLIESDLLRRARHIHVSSYFLQRALAPELPTLFREARTGGVTTSIDPNWDPSGLWDDGVLPLLSAVDVFLPNEMEALSIARISDIERAVARFLEGGVGTVAVKRAEHGSVGAKASEMVHVPAIPTDVVDSTGAGDSFNAGFLAGYLAGEPLRGCLELGNACGALSVLGVGGTAAQPTMAEALDAIERGSAA
jgi:sugar/nucleoside kinase (ribokinase family)